MEQKLYDSKLITLDGRLDEPVWDAAEEHTGFKTFKAQGSKPAFLDTSFKILPCEDRVYIGVKCCETDMEQVLKGSQFRTVWTNDSVELFVAPSGTSYQFYQFAMSVAGQSACQFYSERGVIRPDHYNPDWNFAVYTDKDFWSVEIELPLKAFYMTSNDIWNDQWLVNICRTRGISNSHWTWSDLEAGYVEPDHLTKMGGFPIRPVRNDVRIVSAKVNVTGETEQGLCGTMTVNAIVPETKTYAFEADNAESVTLELTAGTNEFTVPCCFPERGSHKIAVQLTRLEDGEVFKRYYPVRIAYEALQLKLTLPEYRGNFYPGQDYSKVSGKVIAVKPATVKLEGPGFATQICTPDADGNFTFDTAGFKVGEALLTVTMDGRELTKKIRRLAPSGHTMSWISGGNLIINGKAVLRRNMYAEFYRGGEAFDRRYKADNLHQTLEIVGQKGMLQPDFILTSKGISIGEVSRDVKPSDVVFLEIDRVLEANKGREFVYYYLSDEPECRGLSHVYLKYLYDYITEKDPYHVVLMASRSADRYVECNDWFEAHPYINPQMRDGRPRYYENPINRMGNYITCLTKLDRPDKCIGFLPTCFAYKFNNAYADYPTFDEYICHIWAAMICGGKTLWPYAYHDLNDRASIYEGTRYIFSSFEALDQFILHGKRTDLLKTKEVHGVLYELEGEKLFVLVNFTQEPQTATVDGISGTWKEFRHNRTFAGNTFELKPLEVLIGTSTVMDKDMPTYQETAALVDKLEYERTHRENLLFNRYQEIDVVASRGTNKYKLFDGILDNHGWEHIGEGEKFYELDLTKIKPTFTRVSVYGCNVGNAELKFRNNGELSAAAVKEVQTEAYAKTFLLEAPISPDGLRFEFDAHKIELYEIEVF